MTYLYVYLVCGCAAAAGLAHRMYKDDTPWYMANYNSRAERLAWRLVMLAITVVAWPLLAVAALY